MWFWPPRRIPGSGNVNGSWNLVSSVTVGAAGSCSVITGIHHGFQAFLSRNQELAEEQNNWFEAISVNQTHFSSLTASPRDVSPHWHEPRMLQAEEKTVIPEANPWSWTQNFPQIKLNHFAFSETFFLDPELNELLFYSDVFQYLSVFFSMGI